jgi:hypothetical protein
MSSDAAHATGINTPERQLWISSGLDQIVIDHRAAGRGACEEPVNRRPVFGVNVRSQGFRTPTNDGDGLIRL